MTAISEITGNWGRHGWREPVDVKRMQRECLAKTHARMDEDGLDALVLFRDENTHYISGTRHIQGIPGVAFFFPVVSVLIKGDDPYVFTTDDDGVPYSVDDEHVGDPFFVETAPDARALACKVRDLLGGVKGKRIGIDLLNPEVWQAFPEILAGAELVNGQATMMRARRTKTIDELGCLLMAEQITEAAMADVFEALRPGVRGVELNKIFLSRLTDFGLNWSGFEGVFCPIPVDRAEVPHTGPESLPYRKLTTDLPFEEGDLVAVDVAAIYHGYISDFGRTWWCGFGSPPAAKKRLYQQWMETSQRMLDAIRPGNTAAQIHTAAGASITSYVAHSLGHGVEPPLIGGPAMRLEDEEKEVLEPGMIIVVEPYIWEEGVGGFRAETCVVVTDTGCEPLTVFGHGVLGE